MTQPAMPHSVMTDSIFDKARRVRNALPIFAEMHEMDSQAIALYLRRIASGKVHSSVNVDEAFKHKVRKIAEASSQRSVYGRWTLFQTRRAVAILKSLKLTCNEALSRKELKSLGLTLMNSTLKERDLTNEHGTPNSVYFDPSIVDGWDSLEKVAANVKHIMESSVTVLMTIGEAQRLSDAGLDTCFPSGWNWKTGDYAARYKAVRGDTEDRTLFDELVYNEEAYGPIE